MRRLLLSTLVLLLLANTVMADQLSDEAKRDIEAAKSNPCAPILVHGEPIGSRLNTVIIDVPALDVGEHTIPPNTKAGNDLKKVRHEQ